MIDLTDLSDSRTKLMVKNIPNKYTIYQLISLFRQKFNKQFDFVYLVMDTKTDCNQGYGFVNMIPGISKYDFFQQFNNASWPFSKSGKKCEITYATIQDSVSINFNFVQKYLQEYNKYWVPSEKILEVFPHLEQTLRNLEQNQKNLGNNKQQYSQVMKIRPEMYPIFLYNMSFPNTYSFNQFYCQNPLLGYKQSKNPISVWDYQPTKKFEG